MRVLPKPVRRQFEEVWPRANIVQERYDAEYEGTRQYVPCFVVGLCPWVDRADRSRVLVDSESEVEERALCGLPTYVINLAPTLAAHRALVSPGTQTNYEPRHVLARTLTAKTQPWLD